MYDTIYLVLLPLLAYSLYQDWKEAADKRDTTTPNKVEIR